jgi:1,2-dihydroxy-3-keto-5-methylthiopentene dioxygenase
MTCLTIWPEDGPPSPGRVVAAAAIAPTLAPIGVQYERWPLIPDVAADATADAILDAYAARIAAVKTRGGYRAADVVRIGRDTADVAALRAKFLDEHTHSEDEVRFFVAGRGAFYLHAAGEVFQLACEAGDMIAVPAGLKHWFDMGPAPAFAALRWFTNPEGWVARFTGDAIARRFPLFES